MRGCAQALALAVDVLPRGWRRGLARVGARLCFDVLRLRRRVVLGNLAIAFPEWSEERRRAVGRTAVQHLLLTLLEVCQLPRMTPERAARELVVHGREHLDRARAEGRGVLALGSHLGNGDRAMSLIALLGERFFLIAKRVRLRFLDDMLFGVREQMGMSFIDTHGRTPPFEIMAACRRQKPVVFVLDQFMPAPYGIETTFFGRPAATSSGLALFALRTGAPVVPAYAWRDEDDRTHLTFEPPVPLVQGADRTETIRRTTQRYNDILESFVRRHPEQWFWVHKRWKPLREKKRRPLARHQKP